MTAMTGDQVLETMRVAHAAGQCADLRGANLRGTSLAYSDLHYIDLRGADLTDADLTGTLLAGVNLRDTTLRDATLTDAELLDSTLVDADLTGATLTRARLGGAHLTPQQLLGTRGLRPGGPELHRDTWNAILPSNPQQRQLVEHLLRDGWGGTLREAVETVEGLTGR